MLKSVVITIIGYVKANKANIHISCYRQHSDGCSNGDHHCLQKPHGIKLDLTETYSTKRITVDIGLLEWPLGCLL